MVVELVEVNESEGRYGWRVTSECCLALRNWIDGRVAVPFYNEIKLNSSSWVQTGKFFSAIL